MSAYPTTSQYNNKIQLQSIPIYLKKLKPFIYRSSSDSYYLNPNDSLIIIELNQCWNCQMETKSIAFVSSHYSISQQKEVSVSSDDCTIFYNIQKLDKRILTKIQEHYPDYTIQNNQIHNYNCSLIHCHNCKLPINNPFLLNKLIEPYMDPLNITYKGNVSVVTLEGFDTVSITADYKIKVPKKQHSLLLQHIKNKHIL